MSKKAVFTSSGLVRELSEAMFTGVPTHPDWAECLAATIVGMMAGMERYILNDFGKLYGNLFTIYIGASGLSFKTVPLKKIVRPLLKKLTDATNDTICNSYGLTLEEFKNSWEESSRAPNWDKKTPTWRQTRAKLEGIKARFVDLLAPQRFTSEYLISWLSEHPQGMIAGDEFSKTFKGAMKKDYLTDNMEDLSRLSDCDMEKVGTQTRGVEYPESAYICFCSATTYYILTLMTDDFFIQGTGNRILWILDDVREKVDVDKESSAMSFFWGMQEDKEFEQKLDNLTHKLMNIRNLPERVVPLSFEASVMLDRYRLTKYNEAVDLFTVDLLDRDANLVARLAQNAMKLSLVHCIGRYAADYNPEEPYESMEISENDANWAIEKIERHLEHYKRIRLVASRVGTTTKKSYRNDQDRVLYIVSRIERDGKKATKTKIMQQTGWLAPDAEDILDAMLKTKQIEIYTGISGNKKVTYYTLPNTRR